MEKDNGNNNIEFGSENQEKFILDNRFKIVKSIGVGGMGEIFLAEDLKLRRLVAIKSIKIDVSSAVFKQLILFSSGLKASTQTIFKTIHKTNIA